MEGENGESNRRKKISYSNGRKKLDEEWKVMAGEEWSQAKTVNQRIKSRLKTYWHFDNVLGLVKVSMV